MSFPIPEILTALESHAATLGQFERINMHEPKNAVGSGVTCAIWADHINPVLSSGLDSVSAVLRMNARIYTNMLQEPQDAIDPRVLTATSELFAAYCENFTLGGLVRNVDIFGSEGVPLQAQAGYIDQGAVMCRCMTITLPLIVNDAWEEVA